MGLPVDLGVQGRGGGGEGGGGRGYWGGGACLVSWRGFGFGGL